MPLVGPDRYLAARRCPALLVEMALGGACLFPCALPESVPQRGVDQQQTGFMFRLHREIPALPQSYPSVNLGGSSQAKKCLEFAIPGLRASSCLGFFFSPSSPLVWYLQLLCL